MTVRSRSRTARGRSSSASSALKMAVLTPIPSPRERTTTMVKTGCFTSVRALCFIPRQYVEGDERLTPSLSVDDGQSHGHAAIDDRRQTARVRSEERRVGKEWRTGRERD